MVHIYYHIYAVNGVESIIDEQLNLIESNFNFPYILNIGILVPNRTQTISHILEKFNHKKYLTFKKPNITNITIVKNATFKQNEWITLELIEKDKQIFDESDYILYIHTKGASKKNLVNKKVWRYLMNYYNIENVKDVFKVFEKTDFNTYGCLLMNNSIYSGNFWWAKADYVKSINTSDVKKNDRYTAEHSFIQLGTDWKPYSPFNFKSMNDFYQMLFERNSVNKTKLKIKKNLI